MPIESKPPSSGVVQGNQPQTDSIPISNPFGVASAHAVPIKLERTLLSPLPAPVQMAERVRIATIMQHEKNDLPTSHPARLAAAIASPGANVFGQRDTPLWRHEMAGGIAEGRPEKNQVRSASQELLVAASLASDPYLATDLPALGKTRQSTVTDIVATKVNQIRIASPLCEAPQAPPVNSLSTHAKICGLPTPVIFSVSTFCELTGPIHNHTAAYKILGGLLKKPVEQLVKETGIAPSDKKQSAEKIAELYAAANYHGKMIPFTCTDNVKKYVIRAVAKAPNLIMKLPLGYAPTEGGATTVVAIKAWCKIREDGALYYTDSNNIELNRYQQEDGTNIFRNSSNKDVYVQLKNSLLCYAREDGKPPTCIYNGVLTPQIQYRLLDFDVKGVEQPMEIASLSKLPLCDEIWLYETGKRFPFSVTR
ncbi:hypothetical protein ACVBEF_03430 [Glaciimonas sp. GG7]